MKSDEKELDRATGSCLCGGVRYRVRKNVGVGMAFKAELRGDGHAAENELSAGCDPVNVPALADSKTHCGRRAATGDARFPVRRKASRDPCLRGG